jgi:hypothetical protein
VQPAVPALQVATCSKYLKKAGKGKHPICEHTDMSFIFTTNKYRIYKLFVAEFAVDDN